MGKYYNSNKITVPALNKPAECSGCPLDFRGEGFTVPEGTGLNGVILVGQMGSKHEIEEGLPLRPSGAAGAILERSLRKEGLNRQSFKLLNILQCSPNYGIDINKEWGAIEHCGQHRNKVLLNFPESGPGYKRKVILAMGDVATRTLTGLSGKFDMIRGYPEETPFGLVLPTYNPAKLIAGREAKLVGVFRKDLLKAVELAKYGWVEPKLTYITDPTVTQGWEFYERVKKHNGILTFDIENDWPAMPDNLLSVQFSLGRNEGIFFPGAPEFISIIRAILALPIEKWSYNGWKHDSKLLLKYNCPVEGFHGDAFWLFHHVEPDLTTEDTEEGTGLSSRQGLQYAASLHGWWRRWKHLVKSDPKVYGLCDVDCLQYMVPSLKRQAMEEGLWESFLHHVVRYYPILDDLTRRGIPVNEITRLKVREELVKELLVAESEIQEAYPKELKNVHPEKGFVREPKWDGTDYQLAPTTISGAEWFDSDSSQWLPMERRLFKGLEVKVKHDCDCFTLELANAKGKAYKKPKKVWNKECTKCNGKKTFSTIKTEDNRWVCLLPFKPSKDQIVRYMNFKKHKVPHKKGPGGGAETTEFKELERLAEKTGDKLYTKIVGKRKLEKLKSTYIDGWKPSEDGNVHPEYLLSTATGQLASTGPNCFSADTEVLTKRGWIYWPGLKKDDLVAQYDTKDRTIDFALPIGYVDELHNGLMYNVKTEQQIDLLLTKDHRCLLRDRDRNTFFTSPINYDSDRQQIQAGNYIGGEVKYSWAQICLIAALQADGMVHKAVGDKKGRKQGQGGHISWALYKPRKIERLRQALSILKIAFKEHPKKHTEGNGNLNGVLFYISRENVPDWLRDKKFYGGWILDLDRESIQMLSDEIWHWDGNFKRQNGYYSKEKSNVDWMQIIQLFVGRRATARKYTIWHINVARKDFSWTTNCTTTLVNYSGRVYCAAMPKGTVVVRRNGKVAITGQSLNPPKHNKVLANMFRSMIEAPDDRVFVELDFRSYHGATLAAESGDETYYKIAVKAGDAHSFLTSYLVKKPIDPSLPLEELIERLKAMKAEYPVIRDTTAKSAGLGYGFGMQGPGLYSRYPEFFPEGEKQAIAVIDLLDTIYPKNCIWRRSQAAEAARDEKIISKYGQVRRFYSVYSWRQVINDYGIAEWIRRNGEDMEDVFAFRPSNHAHCNFKEVQIILDGIGLLEDHWFCLAYHDALFLVPRRKNLDKVIHTCYDVMTRPIKKLAHPILCPGGLVVDVDIKVGKSWDRMETFKI